MRGPPEAAHTTSAPAMSSSGVGLSRPQDMDPVAQPPREPHLGRARRPHRRLPVHLQGQAPQRPEEQAKRATLLLEAERDPNGPVVFGVAVTRPRALDAGIGAGLHQLVRAREEPLHQLRGRAGGHRPGVEPSEEDLHERPGDLRRQDPLGGLVERADVQRTGVAQRDSGGARRERVVDVHDVEVHATEQILERPAEVDRHRRRPGPGAAGHRDAGADREDRRATIPAGPVPLPGALEQCRRPPARGIDRPAGLAHGRPRPGRRRDDDADALDQTARPTRDRRTR